MKYTSKEISKIINGTVEGDLNIIVNTLGKIEEGKKGDLCFLSNPKYTKFLYSSKASIIIINKDLKLNKKVSPTLIRVDDAYSAFTQLLNIYNQISLPKKGISNSAYISDSAIIGENCYIAPFVFIGENTVIKDNVQIYPHCYIGDESITTLFSGVKIYHKCIVGEENIIHSGVVIGGDGFGFAPNLDGEFTKIQQIGNVITEEYVEIGSNSTIDRATIGSTIIKKGVKLDNQIQVGHNVEIGENSVIAGIVAIAGSTKIGKNCLIGGSSGIAGHLKIGDNVKIAGHTGVGSNIKNGETIQGPYAFNQKDFLRSYIIFKKLPEMYKTLESVKNTLDI